MSDHVPQQSLAWQAIARAQAKGSSRIDARMKLENLPSLDVFDALSAINAGVCSAKVLETSLLMPQYAVSRLLDRMEQDMLISRMPNPIDQRSKTIEITNRGRSVLHDQGIAYAGALADFLGPRAKPGQLERMADLLSLLDAEDTEA